VTDCEMGTASEGMRGVRILDTGSSVSLTNCKLNWGVGLHQLMFFDHKFFKVLLIALFVEHRLHLA
jgi:hypothetical protein